EYRRDGWIWAATSRAQLASWSATVEELDRLGEHPFVELGPDETARRTGSPVHLDAVLEATGAGVQPAKLALGLRRVAIENGVRIFERSPMLRLARDGSEGGWQVSTAGGSVHTQNVVLAMNAWAVRIRQLRPYVLVVGSDIVATDPAPDRLADIGWTDGACISDGRLLVHYYRTTTDGRLVFGKGGGLLPRGPIIGPPFDGRSRRADTVE